MNLTGTIRKEASIYSTGRSLRLETETGAGLDGHISYRFIYALDEPVIISYVLSASALNRKGKKT